MDRKAAVIRLYNYFYNKIYERNFRLDLAVGKQQKMVENFLRALSMYYPGIDSIGINFLIQYFAWSFKVRSEQKTKRNISLGWIVGKKALERFINRKSGEDYYVEAFLHEYRINIDDLRSQFSQEEDKPQLDPAEEMEKVRFTGEARLFNCLNKTTLYNHRSLNCIGCENRLACKSLLKRNHPKLYNKRGYV